MNNQPANTIGKKEIEELLTQGCDERVHILPESALNKYHLNPVQFESLFQRGSCTASVLTRRSFSVTKAFLGKYYDVSYENLLEN